MPEYPSTGGGGLSKGAAAGQYQTLRTNSQSFPANSNTVVTITWPTAFADTNYNAEVICVDESGTQLSLANATGTSGAAYINKTAASIQVTVHNGDAINPHNGHIEALAIHD